MSHLNPLARLLLAALPILAAPGTVAAGATGAEQECVILLHGLARTDQSMQVLASALSEAGYAVANVSYPSRQHEIRPLADIALPAGLEECQSQGYNRYSLVTHSLGGILARQYFSENEAEGLQSVVMLGPPNQGSQVVDNLGSVPGFEWLNGPAGQQLGTGEAGLPASLGAVDFNTGIIAGTRTVNPVLSQFLPNPDDGKVSSENTRVDGMCAFVELPVSHALMMRNSEVITEVLNFLATGSFESESAENDLCERAEPQ